MSSNRINKTKNYLLFDRSLDNRETDISHRKALKESMHQYGFLPCFPIVCKRVGGKLVVMEGQHRLAMAEQLGLEVYWVETTKDFSIAQVNGAAKNWRVIDYATMFANKGKKAYLEVLGFAERYGVPVSLAAALLGGDSSYGSVKRAFQSGTYEVTDREWASSVASLYVSLCSLSKAMNNTHCLKACLRVCHVEEFEAARLITGAKRCLEKLQPYSTFDAYITLFEELYNFNRTRLFGLKAAAIMAMRDRNPAIADDV